MTKDECKAQLNLLNIHHQDSNAPVLNNKDRVILFREHCFFAGYVFINKRRYDIDNKDLYAETYEKLITLSIKLLL